MRGVCSLADFFRVSGFVLVYGFLAIDRHAIVTISTWDSAADQDSGRSFECLLDCQVVLAFTFDFSVVVHDGCMVAAAEGPTDLFVAGIDNSRAR